jgi:hypothetical protein
VKKFLLSLFLIGDLTAASCFGQGTIAFSTNVSGRIVMRVFAPLSPDPTYHQTGNGSADTPTGTQDWSSFSLIGASGTGGPYGGATTFAQLLGVDGADQPESSLAPGAPTTTFLTGSVAGYVRGTGVTFGNIPGITPAATIEMVAWDNSSGLYPTWVQASVAWQAGLIAAGESGRWNQDLHSFGTEPNLINDYDPSQHVVSFNLYFIPEPSALALVSLGIAILFFRRSNSLSRRG